jgi:hypothetical protein
VTQGGRKDMDIEAAKFVTTRAAKEKFTTINKLVAEKKDMVIITKRVSLQLSLFL